MSERGYIIVDEVRELGRAEYAAHVRRTAARRPHKQHPSSPWHVSIASPWVLCRGYCHVWELHLRGERDTEANRRLAYIAGTLRWDDERAP